MADAQPVLDKILDSSYKGPNTQAFEQVYPRPVEGSAIPIVLEKRRQTYFRDILHDPHTPESLRQSARALGGNFSNVITPMIWEGRGVGVISVTRAPHAVYSERELALLRTFADQAVIAIENARLFNETQTRTRELAASIDDLRRTQDRLVQTEKLASLGQLTAGIAHEIKNPLNFVNNFSALSRELLDEVGELLAKAKLAGDEREEIEDLIGMVTSNLDKVVTHGKRADSIVKNMLLHSREGSGTLTSVNVNAMVEEALNLRSPTVGILRRTQARRSWTPCANRCATSAPRSARRRSIRNCSLRRRSCNMRGSNAGRRRTPPFWR